MSCQDSDFNTISLVVSKGKKKKEDCKRNWLCSKLGVINIEAWASASWAVKGFTSG